MIGSLIALAVMLAGGQTGALPELGERDFLITQLTGKADWVPTAAEAREAKAATLAVLATPNPTIRYLKEPSRVSIASRIVSYYFQYEGLSVSRTKDYAPDPSGVRHIVVHGVCMADKDELAVMRAGGELMVYDGGDCYFDAWYNLETKQVVLFSVHGNG